MTRKSLSLTLGCTALLLAGCSQTPAPASAPGSLLPAGSPYANGKQYPWTDRLEAAVPDPYAAGRSYPWVSPTASQGLDTQALNSGRTFLSDLPWTSAKSGWGPVERDRSNGEQDIRDGTTLKIGGRTFAKGLGVHSNSEIRYALGGQCNTFTASVGIDAEVGKLGSVVFEVYGDGKLLYTSGTKGSKDGISPVDVSVAGVKELRLVVSDAGDNNFYDHADWGEAAVNCVAAQPTSDLFLSDLPYTSATNGWGPVEFDTSNGSQAQFDGRPLTIGGQVFAKGLGVHASSTMASTLTYDLNGKCTTFTTKLGIDDEVGDRGSVVFQVFGDGKKLYDSGIVRGSDAAKSARVDMSGVKTLKLTVTDASDTMNFDHADWADARLSCLPPTSSMQSGSLDTSFGQAGKVNVSGVDVVAEDNGTVAVLDANFKVTRLSATGTVVGQSTARSGGRAIALARQTDGKLIVVGQIGGQMAAVRYLGNLTLDPGFGVGGVAKLALGQSPNSTGVSAVATDVTVQPDGKIVLGGYISQGGSDFVLARLQSSGRPDPGFSQNGAVITTLENLPAFSFTRSSDEQIYGLALQSDGKIIVAGEASGGFGNAAVLARYLPGGQLDSSFSGDGIATGTINGYGGFRAVVILPDGQIIAGGGTERFLTSAFLQKFSADGTGGPRAVFQFNNDNPILSKTTVDSLAVQDGGGVIVGGHAAAFLNTDNTTGTYIARFSAALAQDTTFGGTTDGNVSVNGDAAISLVNSGNKIVATTPGVAPRGSTVRLFR